MDQQGNINLFVSEGAGLDSIIAEMTARGAAIDRDAFRPRPPRHHQPGQVVRRAFAKLIGAEKTLVQKSGYFAPLRPANDEDFQAHRHLRPSRAVECAQTGITGLIGHDEGTRQRAARH